MTCLLLIASIILEFGHVNGAACISPQLVKNFTVLDVTGFHTVNVNFCACGETNQSHNVQLLRVDLFPATVTSPQTAATFQLLEMFDILSYESKLSAHEFYQTLFRITDNTRPDTTRVSICNNNLHNPNSSVHSNFGRTVILRCFA